MVNICDKDLLDQTIKEGELEIKISKDYFYSYLVDDEEVIKLLNECSIANLVGENIINKVLAHKLAEEISIRRIDNVPFLMIFKFKSHY